MTLHSWPHVDPSIRSHTAVSPVSPESRKDGLLSLRGRARREYVMHDLYRDAGYFHAFDFTCGLNRWKEHCPPPLGFLLKVLQVCTEVSLHLQGLSRPLGATGGHWPCRCHRCHWWCGWQPAVVGYVSVPCLLSPCRLRR